ncbi:alpha-L-fucosidase [bacterium]|nr:alpha-L-fucosidase [bacterium]
MTDFDPTTDRRLGDDMSHIPVAHLTLDPALANVPLHATPEQMQWWRDAKFGLFIHWGPVSLTGKDLSWSRGKPARFDHEAAHKRTTPAWQYDRLYESFYPARFDAREWVRIARDAGMKYLVFTAKHHDGFCNWHTALTDYHIGNSPFRRDIVRELADACHEGGLAFGIYYSARDWSHPDYLTANHQRYLEYYHGQLRELCSGYGEIDVFFFDHIAGAHDRWDANHALKLVRSLQPGIVIDNRCNLVLGRPGDPKFDGDYDTPEQEIGRMQTDRAWESCVTLAGHSWAYAPDGEMSSPEECVRMLVRCATGDGNLLLNVGPMPTGEIEPRQADCLHAVGRWLHTHGASVYGARGGPLPNGAWGGATRRDNTIYLHILDRTEPIPPLDRAIVSATLQDGTPAEVRQDAGGLVVAVPETSWDDVDTIVKMGVRS